MAQSIEIENMITVGALADKLSLPATKLIGELFKNGVMVTINEKIDVDTAQIIVSELGLDVELKTKDKISEAVAPGAKKQHSADAPIRPPVVAVMGHVDHGKTSLLDVIRSENVASGEAGGITQHISAYQVQHNGRLITFLDTPGHEAFATLREHGAQLTDVVIIVVAADDGVMPQTLEAIRFTRKANSKMVIAITKIDKPGANIEKVKQQLAEQKIMPEEWGGDTVMVPVSSKTKEGVDKLLDMVLLVGDIEDLRADTNVPGEGLVIESHMEKGRGATAVMLVQRGQVSLNDFVVAGTTYAKTRLLQDSNGKNIKKAGPSTPIIISGFKSFPQIGDYFQVVASEKIAKEIAKTHIDIGSNRGNVDMTSSELLRLMNQKTNQHEFNVIIKADVQGSLTSVIDGIKTLGTEDVVSRIVGSGVGNINENDIVLAATSKAVVYGFQTSVPSNIKQLAARDGVSVRLFSVIYELLDDVKSELSQLLEPELITMPIGRLLVKGVFKTTKDEIICGGEVTKGVISLASFADVYRGDKKLASQLKVTNLKRGPTDAKEVQTGEMCGLSLAIGSKLEIQEGDRLEFFTQEIRQRSL